jgi:hypothetical protein
VGVDRNRSDEVRVCNTARTQVRFLVRDIGRRMTEMVEP